METLTSARNPALKEIRKAIAHGGLTADGACVVEGFHLIEEARRSGCRLGPVYSLDSASLPTSFPPTVRLTDSLFRSISTTEATQGVIALVYPPRWNLADLFTSSALVLALDGIQDPGNAGTMLRAAEAFGASGVAFLKGSVSPFNAKALRAAAGSTFRIPFVTAVEPGELLAQSLPVYGLMPGDGLVLGRCPLDAPCILAVGNEGQGIGQAIRSRASAVRIPTTTVESLNAAVAASVALYEAHRQRHASQST